MSLYPSLEDMKVDNMVRAQMAQYQAAPPPAYQPMYQALPSPGHGAPNAHVYPTLGDYMGLELSQDVIALNMPEYQVQTVSLLFLLPSSIFIFRCLRRYFKLPESIIYVFVFITIKSGQTVHEKLLKYFIILITCS